MDPVIRSRFNNTIQEEAARRFAADPGSLELLDGFESFIYSFNRQGQPLILRIGHSLRRPISLIQGEVEWINYLDRGGAGVARAVLSAQGNLVEPLDDGQGEQFLATAFVRVFGVTPGREMMVAPFFEKYGRMVGRMHALAKTFHPDFSAGRRPTWDDPVHLDVENNLPASEHGVRSRFRRLLSEINRLERDSEGYGLVHYDAHTGNMLVDKNGEIHLFDFDDCCYSWFINDIAIVLFYASMWGRDDLAGYARNFLMYFFQGYRQENTLEPAWLASIPDFLTFREIELYAAIHRSFDVNNLTNPWVATFMNGRKERIEAGVPYIDFDFSSLAPLLASGE